MTADGFIVKGKGEAASVNSAAHGAGRKMRRTRAMASVTDKQFKDELKNSALSCWVADWMNHLSHTKTSMK